MEYEELKWNWVFSEFEYPHKGKK